jgi:hypothetical protein
VRESPFIRVEIRWPHENWLLALIATA